MKGGRKGRRKGRRFGRREEAKKIGDCDEYEKTEHSFGDYSLSNRFVGRCH